LEARLGTERFQKLYRSLSLDNGSLAAVVAAGGGVAQEGDASLESGPTASQELGLSDALKEVFAGTDDCQIDVGSLAPLVAKLVDCEQRYFT